MPSPRPLTAESAKAVEGVYRSPEVAVPYTVVYSDGKLWMRRTKRKPFELDALTGDTYTSQLGTLVFERGSAGEIKAFVLDAGRVRGLRFAKN